MGRKRNRRRSSDESGESDTDLETIVVSKKDYSLRPRNNKAPLFTQDLIDEEENQYQSDFEDEIGGETTLITTVRHEANQEPPSHLYKSKEQCVDYDDAISASGVGDSNLVDFESFIDKTEIQVHKRKIQEMPSEGPEEKPKRRGRKAKWMEEVSDGNTEFFHFLDTRESNVEDLIDITPCLDYMNQTEQQEEIAATESSEQIDGDLASVSEIKKELNETVEMGEDVLETLIGTCEQNLVEPDGTLESVKDEPLEDVETFVKSSPVSEIDYVDVNESFQDDNIESVINSATDILSKEEGVHSWSGITAAMSDKSCFLETDGEVAVFRENSPKARFHYLIIPKENIKSLSELSVEHVPVVEHMYNTAKRVVTYPHHKNFKFLVGFNALPAMIIYEQKFCWLHLHVISDDVNFENLILKKQWNAIHTSLFIHPEGRDFARITNGV